MTAYHDAQWVLSKVPWKKLESQQMLNVKSGSVVSYNSALGSSTLDFIYVATINNEI